MDRQLVFIHGRSQQGKNVDALKAEWIQALTEGLARSKLELPIKEKDIRFPYYGNTLDDMMKGKSTDQAADVIVRGKLSDEAEQEFLRSVLVQVKKKAKITDRQLAEVSSTEIVERGPLNWGWVQAVLSSIDRHVPFGSGAALALATADVYKYLTNPAIRSEIDKGACSAIRADVETVVVGHSLGSVVAYNVLRQLGIDLGWQVPLFVTVGSPLSVTAIRDAVRNLKPPTQCPPCVAAWFNAMDDRDVVALYPLTSKAFPLNPTTPAIDNKTDVQNQTTNRHGISGYLNDPAVARKIYDALMAP